MPEREFELYLSLLAKLLRLRPEQRTEIAAELRDHLEARLDDFIRAGHSRDEAVRLALEDLGDAAGLASDFTHISTLRKRRLIMRCTIGTVATLAATILVATALWPIRPGVSPSMASAQPVKTEDAKPATEKPSKENPAGAAPTAGEVAASGKLPGDELRAALEARLDQRITVNFIDTPLSEALIFLGKQVEADILVNRKLADDEGIALDAPVNLELKSTISARTALELVLEQTSGGSLGFSIRDGLIYVTSSEASFEVEVYNCRDLLDGVVPETRFHNGMGGFGGGGGGGMGGGGGGGGFFQFGGAGETAGATPAPGGATPPGAPATPGVTSATEMPLAHATSAAGRALIDVIVGTIHQESWSESGGQGAISEYNGLVVIKQTQTVHRRIGQLLERLRAASSEKPKANAKPALTNAGRTH